MKKMILLCTFFAVVVFNSCTLYSSSVAQQAVAGADAQNNFQVNFEDILSKLYVSGVATHLIIPEERFKQEYRQASSEFLAQKIAQAEHTVRCQNMELEKNSKSSDPEVQGRCNWARTVLKSAQQQIPLLKTLKELKEKKN